MKILHTIASTRADHGGTSRSLPALCEALSAVGLSVQLITTAPSEAGDGGISILPKAPVCSHVIKEPTGLRGRFRSPIAFQRALKEEVRNDAPDIIHDHGAWLPSNRAAASIAQRYGVPLVISPRGMLSGWALRHHRVKKGVAWQLYQRHILKQAALFHVTADEEAEDLRRLGFSGPIAVVPNGVELPESYKISSSNRPLRHALVLSRIHPIKGLPLLIKAWAEVRPANWHLAVAGPDDGGHRAELERLVQAYELDDEISFLGSIPDDEKWSLYRSADLFILPTYSENFGIVIAEALASGLPVITTKGAPWRELQTHSCGWWVDIDAAPLADALRKATEGANEERLAMGKRGRALIEEKYSWSRVADEMLASYHWLVHRTAKPACIV